MDGLIYINGNCYTPHPIYNRYAASKEGFVSNIVMRNPRKGAQHTNGYLIVRVRMIGDSYYKTYLSHRFIWECYNGVITDNRVIDHIDNDRLNNRLSNLQLVTQQVNCKKSAINRDYTFVKDNHKNRRCVKATNIRPKKKDNSE